MALRTGRWWVTSSRSYYPSSHDLKSSAVAIRSSVRTPAVSTSWPVSGVFECLPAACSFTAVSPGGHSALHPLSVGICSWLLGLPAGSWFDAITFYLLSQWGCSSQFAGLTLPFLSLTVYSFTCCFSVLNKLIHSKLKTAIVPARWRHTGPALWKQDPGIQGSCSAVVTQDVRQEPWVEMTYMNWCYLGFVFSFLLKSGEMLCVPASAWHAPQVPGFQKESGSSEWTGLFTQTVGHRESFLAGGGGNHQVLSFLEVS